MRELEIIAIFCQNFFLFRLHISEMIMAIILFFYEMQFEKQTCNTFTTFKLLSFRSFYDQALSIRYQQP